MLCDNCGKREVEVLIKQVVNHEVHHLNLCRVCAEEMGFISTEIPSITISFSLVEPDVTKQRRLRRVSAKKKEQFDDTLVCSSCGTKFGEFREEGLLGCPKCYEAFRFPLGAMLQKVQGAESHWDGTSVIFSEIGPSDAERESAAERDKRRELVENIARIRFEMNEAISREDYERAAELRDILAPMVNSGGMKYDR
jgi:protein arginine kinase activator